LTLQGLEGDKALAFEFTRTVNPWGTILTGAGDEEVVITSEIDLAEVHRAREKFSAFNDRVEWLSFMQ
jgi:predicted amidohydrolase